MLGLIAALHTLAYAIGYIIPTPGFKMTVLYMGVEEVISPRAFGLGMLAVVFYSTYGLIKASKTSISISSFMQALLWLFVTLVYAFNGFYFLAVAMGLCWSLISGYINFVYKFKDDFVNIALDDS